MSGIGMHNDRYSRQALFPQIGPDGQRKLGEGHVLIVGAGALGSVSAETLVRAGVGTVTIVDRDYVETSNLQRQQLYCEEDALLRLPKAAAAKARLERINSDIDIRAVVADAAVPEIEGLAQGVDVILDGTDNFETRLVINDLSQKRGIPWIYGACVGSYGITFTSVPGRTPCLNCLLGTVPTDGATCDTASVIAPAAQMVAAYQASEALKLLVGDLDALHGKLVSFDLWTGAHAAIRVGGMEKPDCPSCGTHRTYPYLQLSQSIPDSRAVRPGHGANSSARTGPARFEGAGAPIVPAGRRGQGEPVSRVFCGGRMPVDGFLGRAGARARNEGHRGSQKLVPPLFRLSPKGRREHPAPMFPV